MPKTSTTAMRTAACPLDSIVRSSAPQPVLIERTASTAASTASTTNAIRISAFLQRALVELSTSVISRIGPNSPTAPGAEQVRPEARAQLALVAQDRDQRADRGRRQRGARCRRTRARRPASASTPPMP